MQKSIRFLPLLSEVQAITQTIFRDSGLWSLAVFDNLFNNRIPGDKIKPRNGKTYGTETISLYSSKNTHWKYKPVIYLFSVEKISHARFKIMLFYVLTAEVISQSSFKEQKGYKKNKCKLLEDAWIYYNKCTWSIWHLCFRSSCSHSLTVRDW